MISESELWWSELEREEEEGQCLHGVCMAYAWKQLWKHKLIESTSLSPSRFCYPRVEGLAHPAALHLAHGFARNFSFCTITPMRNHCTLKDDAHRVTVLNFDMMSKELDLDSVRSEALQDADSVGDLLKCSAVDSH